MGISSTRVEFIKEFASKCNTICPTYGLKAINAIVAQACCESKYGESGLSSKYHNYFGMKCGSSYKGKSVNMTTKEEYTVGTLTTIKDNFRAYDTMGEGIKGYCEFITGMSRYKNLIGVTDDVTYITNIKKDGWATSSTYITTLKNFLKIVNSVLADTTNDASTTDNIKKAQNALNDFINARLEVDGVIGKLTRNATAKALQYAINKDKDTSIEVNGTIGDDTLEALKTCTVKRGTKSYLVTWSEIALTLLGYYTSDIEIAGTFGAGMQSATKTYQSANGLSADGIIGQNTFNKLVNSLGLI